MPFFVIGHPLRTLEHMLSIITRKRPLPRLLMHHGRRRLDLDIAQYIFHGHGDGMLCVRCQGYLGLPGGEVVFAFDLILLGTIDNDSDPSDLTQSILSGAAYGQLGFFGGGNHVGKDNARFRRLLIFHGVDDETSTHTPHGHHHFFDGIGTAGRSATHGEALPRLNMPILGGKGAIVELVLPIGDADAGAGGNAGKRNRAALNKLTWGNAILRCKAKAVGCGDGLWLWIGFWLGVRSWVWVTTGIARLIVVTGRRLTRRWLVRFGLGVAATAATTGR